MQKTGSEHDPKWCVTFKPNLQRHAPTPPPSPSWCVQGCIWTGEYSQRGTSTKAGSQAARCGLGQRWLSSIQPHNSGRQTAPLWSSTLSLPSLCPPTHHHHHLLGLWQQHKSTINSTSLYDVSVSLAEFLWSSLQQGRYLPLCALSRDALWSSRNTI